MKTFFTVLLLTIFTSSEAQLYMAAEDGISIKKVNDDAEFNSINTVSTKSSSHYTMFSIGAKFGYEFNPLVIELDGKLNLNMSGMIGIYGGVILPANKENNFHLTPLIGISPGHSVAAAARLQYKHFLLEVNKITNTIFYSVGIKCYLYE